MGESSHFSVFGRYFGNGEAPKFNVEQNLSCRFHSLIFMHAKKIPQKISLFRRYLDQNIKTCRKCLCPPLFQIGYGSFTITTFFSPHSRCMLKCNYGRQDDRNSLQLKCWLRANAPALFYYYFFPLFIYLYSLFCIKQISCDTAPFNTHKTPSGFALISFMTEQFNA